MQWGSEWAFTTHAGLNPFCLCCCPKEEEVQENLGGSSFRDGTNPLLRVAAPQPNAVIPLETNLSTTSFENAIGSTADEFVYATETFDRRQPVRSRKADTRWLRRHRDLKVPVIEARLVVAFQKFLRNEEAEFLTLVIAMDEEVCCHE